MFYPAHGAGGRLCGKKPCSKETSDTLGKFQKGRQNYALQEMRLKERVYQGRLITGLTPPPVISLRNVHDEHFEGYDSIDTILERGVRPLTPAGILKAAANETGAVILDTR